MSEKIRSFRDLNIWKLGIEIVEDVYKLSKEFPASELYGITVQSQRCAVSIPSNIAEGFARKHSKEYRQFLSIALGSCAELETHMEIASRLKYISAVERDGLLEKTDHLARMTMSLIKCLR